MFLVSFTSVEPRAHRFNRRAWQQHFVLREQSYLQLISTKSYPATEITAAPPRSTNPSGSKVPLHNRFIAAGAGPTTRGFAGSAGCLRRGAGAPPDRKNEELSAGEGRTDETSTRLILFPLGRDFLRRIPRSEGRETEFIRMSALPTASAAVEPAAIVILMCETVNPVWPRRARLVAGACLPFLLPQPDGWLDGLSSWVFVGFRGSRAGKRSIDSVGRPLLRYSNCLQGVWSFEIDVILCNVISSLHVFFLDSFSFAYANIIEKFDLFVKTHHNLVVFWKLFCLLWTIEPSDMYFLSEA